jgi:alpha-beta hydrolase superfamily lysophospholipase
VAEHVFSKSIWIVTAGWSELMKFDSRDLRGAREVKRLRYCAALLGVAVLFAGGLQPTGAKASPGIRVALRSTDSYSRPRSSSAQVYLFRGLLNVFSLGMDQLAAELRASGIPATVANHSQWGSVADEIARRYRADPRGPIILIGHSLGADAAMSAAEYLGQMGVPVALVVPFDGTSAHVATANVARVLNFYKNTSARINRGPGFHGQITNFYVRDVNVDHFNIDKDPALHSMVIRQVRAIGSVARPREHRIPSNSVPSAGAPSSSS